MPMMEKLRSAWITDPHGGLRFRLLQIVWVQRCHVSSNTSILLRMKSSRLKADRTFWNLHVSAAITLKHYSGSTDRIYWLHAVLFMNVSSTFWVRRMWSVCVGLCLLVHLGASSSEIEWSFGGQVPSELWRHGTVAGRVWLDGLAHYDLGNNLNVFVHFVTLKQVAVNESNTQGLHERE